MDFNVVLGTLPNRSLDLELTKILKILIDMYREGSLDIIKLGFYSFELHSKKIVKRMLLTLKVDDIKDLTVINEKDLVNKLNINHKSLIDLIKTNKLDKDIILDNTIYLEVIN